MTAITLSIVLPYMTAILITTSRGNKAAVRYFHTRYFKARRLLLYSFVVLPTSRGNKKLCTVLPYTTVIWQQHHVETRQLCTLLPYTTAILITTSRSLVRSIHDCYSDNNITWKQGSFVRYFHTRYMLFWQQHHVETRQLSVLPYMTAILIFTWKQGTRYFHTRLFWQQHHVETKHQYVETRTA